MLMVISHVTFVIIFILGTNSFKCNSIAIKVLFVFNLWSRQDIKELIFLVDLILKQTRANCSVFNNTHSMARLV